MELAPQERRDALIVEYQNYVHHVVGYLVQSMGLPSQFYDDFVAAGYLGLVEAAQRFDFDSKCPFKNFAFLRIRGAVIDSIRECSELSGKAYRYARALQAADSLRNELSQQELATGGATALGSVLDYAARSILAYRLTQGSTVAGMSGAAEFSENPEAQLEQKQSAQDFRSLVATLPAKERLVIEEYYFNDKSFAEIAEQHEGLSKSWISRLHSRALARLQQTLSEREAIEALGGS